jgi:hypothetical protein
MELIYIKNSNKEIAKKLLLEGYGAEHIKWAETVELILKHQKKIGYIIKYKKKICGLILICEQNFKKIKIKNLSCFYLREKFRFLTVHVFKYFLDDNKNTYISYSANYIIQKIFTYLKYKKLSNGLKVIYYNPLRKIDKSVEITENKKKINEKIFKNENNLIIFNIRHKSKKYICSFTRIRFKRNDVFLLSYVSDIKIINKIINNMSKKIFLSYKKIFFAIPNADNFKSIKGLNFEDDYSYFSTKNLCFDKINLINSEFNYIKLNEK